MRVSDWSRTPSSVSASSPLAVSGRRAVDADRDLEGDLVQRRAVVVGVGTGRRKPGTDRDRLPEPHVRRAAVRAALGAGVLGQPLQALGLLLRAGLLGSHLGDLVEPVVGDRRGHQVDVLDPAALDGLGDVAEQAVAGAADLAGARAPALEVPLEVEALGQQEREVLLDHGLVDLVVAEAAADEDDAGPPGQVADRPDPEVGAAHHVVAREVVAGEHVAEHQGVDVGAVGWQEDERVALVELAQPGQAGLVGEHLPGRGVQRLHHRVEHVDGRPALHGDQLVEALLGLLEPLVEGQPHLGRDLGDLVAELLASQDLLADGVGHLVAVADLGALLALEGDHGRSAYERRERLRVGLLAGRWCWRAGGVEEALAQVAEQGGLARHDATAVGERAVSLRESQVAGRLGVASRASSESLEVPARRSTGGSHATRTGITSASSYDASAAPSPSPAPVHGVEDDGDRRVLLARPGVDHRALHGRGVDRDRDHGDRLLAHTSPFRGRAHHRRSQTTNRGPAGRIRRGPRR